MAERLLRVALGAPPSGGKSAARRRSALRPAGRRPSQQAGSRRASAGEAEERAAEIRRLRLEEAQAEAAQHNVEKMLDLQTNVNKVLRRRAERSREDLSKMYARLAKLTGRKGLKETWTRLRSSSSDWPASKATSPLTTGRCSSGGSVSGGGSQACARRMATRWATSSKTRSAPKV
ncbi:unnamed protein product [Prorocentrum cordatum]|uniref:Uncharacterized protein n=1 Tax=Prorocentrum cordatum TaxID=2364126 RepID=A0ABN9RFW2_9DINO|nr:unnamed protein product [Polarella glacialis]